MSRAPEVSESLGRKPRAFQAQIFNRLTDGPGEGIPDIPNGLHEGDARIQVYLVPSLKPSVGGNRPRVQQLIN